MKLIEICPLCGHKKLDRVGEAVDCLVSNDLFEIKQCLACGVMITDPQPRPDEIGNYYQSEDYISHQDARKSLFERVYGWVKRIMISRKMKLVDRYFEPGLPRNIVDFGCATGAFLEKAQQEGYRAMGVEPNDLARTKAKEKGLHVVKSFEDIDLREDVGCVSMWHVLEHVPDPADLLDQIKEKLVANGLIIVAVPDHTSWDAEYYGQHWAAWDVPRHLYHFDVPALKGFFERKGLVFQGKYPLWFDSFYVSLLSEKNRKTGVLGQARGFLVGMVSFVLALMGRKPWSSHVFVFRNSFTQ